MPPVSLLIKPASGLCNLRCKYCFYADEMSNRDIPSYGRMRIETMTKVLEKTFDFAEDSVTLAFQGGEPTLVGLDFFRETVSIVDKLNRKRLKIHYALQTNGLSLNSSWATFFRDNHFLIGLSIDGVAAIHDRYRVDVSGSGTHAKVMEIVALLREYQVDFNVLTVITGKVAANAEKVYQFFQKNNLPYQQYIPCLDPLGEPRGRADYSLSPERYETFLKKMFDCWYSDIKSGKFVYNRTFENYVGMLLLHPPESCGMVGHCSEQNVIEADGSVYPCDFYVLDPYKLGNLLSDSFEDIQHRRREICFIEKSREIHPQCASCRLYPLCRGGCRRDRELPDGAELGLNYYCRSFQGFFQYALPRLEELAWLAKNGYFQQR